MERIGEIYNGLLSGGVVQKAGHDGWKTQPRNRGKFGKKGYTDGMAKDKTGLRTVDTKELQEFITESLENQSKHTPNKRVIIGTVNDEAQKRIEDKSGVKVKNINIDNHSIVHAVTQLHHGLEPQDILLAVNVINTSTDITLSDKKHQNCDVLTFKKDIDGEITFLAEVRAKNGYLLVFNAWRQKKTRSRRRPDAT